MGIQKAINKQIKSKSNPLQAERERLQRRAKKLQKIIEREFPNATDEQKRELEIIRQEWAKHKAQAADAFEHTKIQLMVKAMERQCLEVLKIEV